MRNRRYSYDFLESEITIIFTQYECPAKLSMIHYFKSTERKWRGRPRITLPLRLAEDMAAVGAGTLNTIADLRRLEMLSCDRSSWREVVTKICER